MARHRARPLPAAPAASFVASFVAIAAVGTWLFAPTTAANVTVNSQRHAKITFELIGETPGKLITLTTNSDGRASRAIPAGSYRICLVAENGPQLCKVESISQDGVIAVDLSPAAQARPLPGESKPPVEPGK